MRPERLNDTLCGPLIRARHPSGLPILLHHRPGWVETVAWCTARFGSMHRTLPDGTVLPAGVAHFLEHKLFEDGGADVAERFAARGAHCNAGTEFARTTYLFSCIEHIEENLSDLMRLVRTPSFTDEGVARERGIIGQEIRMYDDDPEWAGYFALLQALYPAHPIRDPIAGTEASIADISADLLRRCHAACYAPSNLILAVASPEDPERLLACIDAAMGADLDDESQAPGDPIRWPTMGGTHDVSVRRFERPFSLSEPQLLLGWKDDVDETESSQDATDRELEMRLLLSVMWGRSSAHHQRLYDAGLVDGSFSASYTAERGVGFTVVATDTPDPEGCEAALLDIVHRCRADGLDEEAVASSRHALLGRSVRIVDASDAVAGLLIDSELRGYTPDELLARVDQISLERLTQRLHSHFRDDRLVTAILRPTADASAG